MAEKEYLKNRVGEKFTTNEGYKITIIDYFGANSCTVKFEDETVVENREYNNIINGRVKKPEASKVGEKFITNEGYEVKIIEYYSNTNCTIMFSNNDVLENIHYNELRRGSVKNPFHPSVHGKGYLGKKSFGISKNPKAYRAWASCIQRCYEINFHKKSPSYKGCLVHEPWLNFQNFAEWYEENYNPKVMQGWHLDKDTLIKGNKIYSPETCCFVPHEINSIFKSRKREGLPIGVERTQSGKFSSTITKNKIKIYLGLYNTPEEAFQAYKIAKEEYIKEVADKWRGQITEPTYYAMYTYQVEITD